jgi:hypothetical protein
MSWWKYIIPVAMFGGIFLVIYIGTKGHPLEDDEDPTL